MKLRITQSVRVGNGMRNPGDQVGVSEAVGLQLIDIGCAQPIGNPEPPEAAPEPEPEPTPEPEAVADEADTDDS